MNGFLAALKKDMCLFFRKGGLFSLLFPLLLLPLFLFFFRGSSGGLQAFPVSVIDEDETLMSKTLIRQMEEVELFSEVHKISREDISEELEKGKCRRSAHSEGFLLYGLSFSGRAGRADFKRKKSYGKRYSGIGFHLHYENHGKRTGDESCCFSYGLRGEALRFGRGRTLSQGFGTIA